METKELSNLETMINEGKSKATPQENLIKAFSIFTEETQKLKESYDLLKKEFSRLKNELKNKDETLKEKVLELNATSLYLTNLLQNIQEGILFITEDGFITTSNKFAEELLGLSSKEMELKEYTELFADDFFGFSMAEVLISGEAPPPQIITIKTPNECSRHVEVSVSVAEKDGLFQMGVIVLLKDITQMRRLELIAQRNDRMKELGEMAAQVAHEIRNPLGGIRGFASLLCRDLESNASQKKLADYIVEGADRLNHLVTEVLDYARPLHTQLQTCDLEALILSVQEPLKEDSLIKERITFENSLGKGFCVSIDQESIRRALLNLYVNGAQATESSGTLKTSLSRDQDKVILTIEDKGCGIPKENLEKIFSPFFTTKMGGTGFGLSEVYKVVQANGGEIEVESEVGKGTKFALSFPLVNQLGDQHVAG